MRKIARPNAAATLSACPRTLYELWDEYTQWVQEGARLQKDSTHKREAHKNTSTIKERSFGI